MTELKTTIHHESGRIDKVLTNLFTDYSRSQIQLWLKNGAVSVNGQPVKANYKVKQGDEITVLIPEPETLDVVPENIPLTIVYEDEDVAVINKPQGMVVHPSAGHTHGTMVNALMYHIKDLSTINGVIRPGIVHRIDKDTSGLLMVAKNDQAHESLACIGPKWLKSGSIQSGVTKRRRTRSGTLARPVYSHQRRGLLRSSR